MFLATERRITRSIGDAAWAKSTAVRFAAGILTYALVCIAWVFFRAKDLPTSAMIVASMLGAIPAQPILPSLGILKVVAVTACIGAHIWLRHRIEDLGKAVPAPVITAGWAVTLFSIILMQGAGDASSSATKTGGLRRPGSSRCRCGCRIGYYLELCAFTCPEWSHLSASDSVEYSKRLVAIMKREGLL